MRQGWHGQPAGGNRCGRGTLDTRGGWAGPRLAGAKRFFHAFYEHLTLCGCTIMPLYSATILEVADRCTGWMPVRRPPISRSLRTWWWWLAGGGQVGGPGVAEWRRSS